MNISIERMASPTGTIVYVGDARMVFSYETCVAFRIPGSLGLAQGPGAAGWHISENIWGPTTGKHIVQGTPIHDRSDRVPREEFLDRLADFSDMFDAGVG